MMISQAGPPAGSSLFIYRQQNQFFFVLIFCVCVFQVGIEQSI